MRHLLTRLERLESQDQLGATNPLVGAIRQRCAELLAGPEPDPMDPATQMLMDSILRGLR